MAEQLPCGLHLKHYLQKQWSFLDVFITVARSCPVKKVFLKISQNSQENTQACNFIKKETEAQVFSCEFSKIFNNTFFHRTPPVATYHIQIELYGYYKSLK